MARRLDRKVLLALGVLGLTVSCDGSDPANPTGPNGNQNETLSITITPDSADVFATVGSQAYTATVRDGAGNIVTDAVVTWSSSAQATVTPTQGATTTARGVSAGRATITATTSGTTRTAVLNVRAAVAPASLGARTINVATNGALSQPAPGLLAGAQLGTPAARVLSFGGGTLGGSVTSFAAGQVATFETPAAVPGHPGAPGAPVPVGAASQAAQGSVVVNEDGGFTITPPAGYDGTLTFQLRVGNVVGSLDGTVTVGVDAPPAVVSNTPVDGAAGVSPAATIALSFSEPVTATPAAFRLECPAGSNIALALSGSGSSNLVLTPSTPLPRGVSCVVTVLGAQVRDADTDDGPDALPGDNSFAFSTEPAVSPRAQDDDYDVVAGVALDVGAASGVLRNDGLGVPAATITSFGGGSLGGSVTSNVPGTMVSAAGRTVRLNADGSLSVSASSDLEAISFAYRLTNSAGTSDATVTIAATPVDDAPAVVSSTPSNNQAGVLPGATISIGFDEPVTANAASFSLQCPAGAGNARTFTVSGSGTDQVVLTPTAPLPVASCAVRVIGSGVRDLDPVDPPDRMENDYSFGFSVGAPPVAVADAYFGSANAQLLVNAPGVLGNDALGVPAATVLSYGGGSLGGSVTTNAAGVAVPFATGSVTLSANGALAFNPPVGFTGTLTFQYRMANAAGSADATVTITVDDAPSVVSTTPLNGATDQPTNTNVSITFSEPVSPTGSWVSAICTSSGVRNNGSFSVSGGPSTYTLDPAADFTQGESCTFTVHAAGVPDADANDPPDGMAADYVFSFTMDAAPAVQSTLPANGGVLATNGDIVVTFTEPMAIGVPPLSCTVTGLMAVDVIGGPVTFTLDPLVDLQPGESCTLTLPANLNFDLDGNDPPNNLTADFAMSFTVDAAPQVQSTAPANGATNVAPNGNIGLTFSEGIAFGALPSFVCTTTGPVDYQIVAGPGQVSWTINPDDDLAPSESCTITVSAAEVFDLDSYDPPEHMSADHVFSFTVADAAPAVLSTSPANGAINVAANSNISVTFTEAVLVATPPVFQCTISGTLTVPADIAASGGPVTYTLNPINDFAPGETCTGSLLASAVTDLDANDPPENMAADFNFSFTIASDETQASALEREVWATLPALRKEEREAPVERDLRPASAGPEDAGAVGTGAAGIAALGYPLASRRRARRRRGRQAR